MTLKSPKLLQMWKYYYCHINSLYTEQLLLIYNFYLEKQRRYSCVDSYSITLYISFREKLYASLSYTAAFPLMDTRV